MKNSLAITKTTVSYIVIILVCVGSNFRTIQRVACQADVISMRDYVKNLQRILA